MSWRYVWFAALKLTADMKVLVSSAGFCPGGYGDDRVELVRLPGDVIEGSSPALLRNHLELRGIGIVNVRDLSGRRLSVSEKTSTL